MIPCHSIEDCVAKSIKSKLQGDPQASIALDTVSSTTGLCYSLDSVEWTLSNTGAYSKADDKVKWEITATKTLIDSLPTLKANGILTITNSGGAPADIGNITVNLQRKALDNSGKFFTIASDIADVTNGDLFYAESTCSGEKSSYVVESKGVVTKYVESTMSGPLTFWNEDGNSIFSIVGGWSIAPGATVRLLYQALFYVNDPTIKHVRIETYVTFGNAGARGGSGASANDVAYRGDCIPYDNVRSVPFRVSLEMPPLKVCSDTATLSSISTDVTVTSGSYTNYVTDIGIGGTELLTDTAVRHVSVTPDPLVSDITRTFTNCAHLHSASDYQVLSILVDGIAKEYKFICCEGVDLTACDSVTIEEFNPPPCNCSNDGYITFTQGGWGSPPSGNNPGALLSKNFEDVYPTGTYIGHNLLSSYWAQFTTASAIQAFLPQGGPPSRFTANQTNPTTSSAGVFAGQVLALQLNVDFSAANITYPPPSGQVLGDLVFTSDPATVASLSYGWMLTFLQGKTISEFLAVCNDVIGGSVIPSWLPGATVSDLNNIADLINNAFNNENQTPFSNFICQSVICIP